MLIAFARIAVGQTANFWINNGFVLGPPQIDALNVVNNNYMGIFVTNGAFNIQLFDTSNTQNFTNSATGVMEGSPGFQFDNAPADWEQKLHGLDDVTSVQHEGAGMFRVLTGNGSRTTTQLVEMAVQRGVQVKTLTVQNTTLDDVFVHYTGRQLRDELQKAYAFVMPQRPGLQP